MLIGPFYGLRDMADGADWAHVIGVALLAALAFALASSGCYVVNDIFDRVADQSHPRKKNRPIAAGHISVRAAALFALCLYAIAFGLLLFIGGRNGLLVAGAMALYVGNVMLYSAYMKHKVIADVMSLAIGFVLRVIAGCAAVGIEPSIWLLNVTLFLSMFLAFGKRLGERRILAPEPGQPERAVKHRRVQALYSENLLQMAVIATAVMTLMTYSTYVRDQAVASFELNMLLWATLLPATYGLLRAVVRVEKGDFDDPTLMALGDRGFQASALAFVALTAIHLWLRLQESGLTS